MDIKVRQELAKLDPDVPFRYKIKHLHHTWARTLYSRPELYLQPESVAEIQKAVTLARRCRRRLVVVGNGHSPSDLTCSSSWMINLDNFNRILSSDTSTGLVTFQAGLSLHDLGLELAKLGLSIPNLGSIDAQSVAGAISTGTHGSSLRFGLLSQSITAISLCLSNGQIVRCSATSNAPLFRAALLSLGALGIIAEITFRAVPDFAISWKQDLHPLSEVLDTWSTTLWTTAPYTRVWWLPYLRRAVFWRAHPLPASTPRRLPAASWYGGRMGYYTYHNLLALCQWVPRLLPWVEWFVFGMQYGFRPGTSSTTAIEPAREGLLMDCLYSQFVNEWALPLAKGPEAIRRLDAWINGAPQSVSGIPFSSAGLYVHCPIEVRVSDTSSTTTSIPAPASPEDSADATDAPALRPFLDPTDPTGPTLYLNATLYRPYGRDPPCRARYYEAFEWLMRELGGRPHWAKNFETCGPAIPRMYGPDMARFLDVRAEADPDGMFLGAWHARVFPPDALAGRPLAEREVRRARLGVSGAGDGLEWVGELSGDGGRDKGSELEGDGDRDESPSPPATATSEESFDLLAKGEASVYEATAALFE